ncbi:MAG TPA: mandelate racemase/muconate lactonizing enzyme family protein [Xanthobacteraceae bacterium]|jgi:D-galactarolactone cycloisomerase|nr:mandelate racemase/muconate lactonizing enzyme family protein [Xanthobacteraceae bacterium]
MPTITGIEVISLEHVMKPGEGYGNARGINHRRGSSIVSLTTSDGVVGLGEAQGPLRIIAEYVKLIAPHFIGRSLFNFSIIATELRNRLYHFGAQGHFISALGGINIAVYDAIGRTHGVAVHDLIGGCASENLACYATTGYFTDNPKVGIAEQMSRFDLDDFVGVKIKIGAGIASDVARVQAARKAIGDSKLLMVDYNGNYTVDVALESLRKIEKFNILFCEEPLPPADIQGYAELRMRSPIRVGAGEAHYAVGDFKRLIEARAIDIAEPSLTGGGGFDEMKAAALYAMTNNVRIAVSCWGGAIALNAALHFAASLPVWPHTANAPYPLMVEYDCGDNPLRDRIVTNPIRPSQGKIAVPKSFGLGIELDAGAVARYRV